MEILRLTRTYKATRRLQQILNVFLKHGFGRAVDQIHLGRYIPFGKRLRAFGQWPALKGPTVPERLRTAFAELGPSFIKLAQLLSSRPDLITARYAEEFKRLQDEVPPFPPEEARRIIEEELGRPLYEIFSYFQERPVAAASIAQVHHASLLDGSGVVVKVQRPSIRDTIETDIDIMTTLARLMERYIAESRFFNPLGIVLEFERTIRKELDFTQEARNAARFGRNFKDRPEVCIPKIYPEFLSEKVLVMERIEGVRIDDIGAIEYLGLDRRELARIGVDAYFKMVLEDGFFHADPHPGNIFAMPSGQVGFMDFGIVGRVGDEMKEAMAATFIAFVKKDIDALVGQYIEMGLLPEEADIEDFRREFRADLADLIEPYYGMTLKEINFGEYLDAVVHLAMRHNMKIPSDLLLINKAMLILENLGVRLDPDFDFVAASEPYASRLIRQRYSPSRAFEKVRRNVAEAGDFVAVFPRQLKTIIGKTLRDDLHLKLSHIGLDNLIKDMDRSSNRISFALLISAMLISSAIMHATQVPPVVFGLSILGLTAFGLAFLLGIWLLVSIIRSGRL